MTSSVEMNEFLCSSIPPVCGFNKDYTVFQFFTVKYQALSSFIRFIKLKMIIQQVCMKNDQEKKINHW